MDKKQTDAIAIRQRLQPSDDLIIVGVAVVVPGDLTYLLERVNDDKGSAWMLPQKISELLVEAAAKLTGRNREEQALIFCRAEHPIGTLLQAAVIVLKRKIQHRPFTDGIIPKRCAGADMIGKLGHQEALAQLRSADKKVSTPVEKTVHKGRLALVHIVQQFRH